MKKWLKKLIAGASAVFVLGLSIPMSAFAVPGGDSIHVKNVPDHVSTVTVGFTDSTKDVTLSNRNGNQIGGPNTHVGLDKDVITVTLNWDNGAKTVLDERSTNGKDGQFVVGNKGEGTFQIWIIGDWKKPIEKTVSVNYYKDSVSQSNFLGFSTFKAFTNDEITLAAGTSASQLDFKKPAAGYNSGVQQGTIPYIVKNQKTNVINIVYGKKDLSVTVNYYKGSVDEENLLGSSTYSTTAHVGDTDITLAAGTEENQLDFLLGSLPDGYNSGAQQGGAYEIIDGTNVINVVYTPIDQTVVVNYYKDSVTSTGDASHFLGSSVYSTTAHVDDPAITLAAGTEANHLDYKKPATGVYVYNSGVQQGAPCTILNGTNVINVLYTQKNETVTVNYYKGSVGAANLLGSSTYSTTAHVGDPAITLAAGTSANQLDYKKPAAGYVSGVQQGAPYTVVDGNNVINVVYAMKDLTVTVNYYKGSVSTANLLGSSTFTTKAHMGDTITLVSGTAAGQLDFKKPASGYSNGAQQGVPYVVKDSATNTINVVYFAVAVIKDSPTPVAGPKTGDTTDAGTIAIVLFSMIALAGGAIAVKKAIRK